MSAHKFNPVELLNLVKPYKYLLNLMENMS